MPSRISAGSERSRSLRSRAGGASGRLCDRERRAEGCRGRRATNTTLRAVNDSSGEGQMRRLDARPGPAAGGKTQLERVRERNPLAGRGHFLGVFSVFFVSEHAFTLFAVKTFFRCFFC